MGSVGEVVFAETLPPLVLLPLERLRQVRQGWAGSHCLIRSLSLILSDDSFRVSLPLPSPGRPLPSVSVAL